MVGIYFYLYLYFIFFLFRANFRHYLILLLLPYLRKNTLCLVNIPDKGVTEVTYMLLLKIVQCDILCTFIILFTFTEITFYQKQENQLLMHDNVWMNVVLFRQHRLRLYCPGRIFASVWIHRISLNDIDFSHSPQLTRTRNFF